MRFNKRSQIDLMRFYCNIEGHTLRGAASGKVGEMPTGCRSSMRSTSGRDPAELFLGYRHNHNLATLSKRACR